MASKLKEVLEDLRSGVEAGANHTHECGLLLGVGAARLVLEHIDALESENLRLHEECGSFVLDGLLDGPGGSKFPVKIEHARPSSPFLDVTIDDETIGVPVGECNRFSTLLIDAEAEAMRRANPAAPAPPREAKVEDEPYFRHEFTIADGITQTTRIAVTLRRRTDAYVTISQVCGGQIMTVRPSELPEFVRELTTASFRLRRKLSAESPSKAAETAAAAS